MDTCLDYLKEKTKLDSFKVVYRPKARSGLDLSDLLSDGSDEEIMTNALQQGSMHLLKSRGFSMGTTLKVLRQSIEPKHPRANIWLLHPAEIIVR